MELTADPNYLYSLHSVEKCEWSPLLELRMRIREIKMAAVGSASGGKLYRFPPTRELHADYDAVVPAAIRGRKRARELEQYLRLRNEEEVAGEIRTSIHASSRDYSIQRERSRERVSSNIATSSNTD